MGSHESAVPTCTEIPEPLLRCFFATLEFFLVILGEVTQMGFIAPLDCALIRFEFAHHNFQQCRLSNPVGAHDRDAISPMNEQVDPVQYLIVAERLSDTRYLEDIAPARTTRREPKCRIPARTARKLLEFTGFFLD